MTAGGRIVPNTRGSSPTAKSVKDKPAVDVEPSPAPSHENKSGTSQPALQPAPPIYPATAAAAAAAAAPRLVPPFVPSLSLLPLAYPYGLPAGYPLTYPALAAGQAHQQSLAHAATTNDSQAIIAGADGNVDEKIGGIKLSPPDQFDYTRPFLYNGQLIFPPPLAYAQQIPGAYLPINWLCGASLPAGVLPSAASGIAGLHGLAGVQGVHGLAGVNGVANPLGLKSPYTAPPNPAVPLQMQTAPYNPSAMQNLGGQAQQQSHAAVAPPISSIRPSEITKKQLDSLRSALRYYEDQLQYNKHQIDEKHIEHQAQTVRAYISSFERTLKTQLATEELLYPKTEKTSEGNGTSGLRSGAASKSSSSSEGARNSNFDGGAKPTDGQRAGNQKMGINPSKPFTSSATSGNGHVPADDVRTFKIPSHAALAQPFQPQGMSYASGQSSGAEVDEFYQDIQQPQEEVEKRLLAASSGFWGPTYPPTTPKNKADGSEGTAVSGVRAAPAVSQAAAPTVSQSGVPSAAVNQVSPAAPPTVPQSGVPSATVNHVSQAAAPNVSQSSSPSATVKQVSQAAHNTSSQQPRKGLEPGRPGHPDVPYLVGTLPKGVNPRTAKDTDYQYHRELTPDEICARHLYWGKAPRSVTKGLPKFDGKHFYPPSPVKESPPPSPAPKFHGREIPVGSHVDAHNVPQRKYTVVDPFAIDESKMWKDGLGPAALGLPSIGELSPEEASMMAAIESAKAASSISPSSSHARRPSSTAERQSMSEHRPGSSTDGSGSGSGGSAASLDSAKDLHEGSSITSGSKDSDIGLGQGISGAAAETKSPNGNRRRDKRSTEKDKAR